MIPRPATVEPGGPPPWTPRAGITVESVLDALGRTGRLLTTDPHPAVVGVPVAEPAAVVQVPAAVLVALFDERGEARVVLTRRSTRLRTHTGQVSFPGGRIEPGEDPVHAALREAHEEVRLDPATVRPVGLLAPAFAFASGAPITPVVATLGGRPDLRANPDEVDRVFDVALFDLAARYSEEVWHQPGRSALSVYVFTVATETVWGATARMLVDLLTMVLVPSASSSGSSSGR